MIDALKIAQQFHETYERLSLQFGYSTRLDTRIFDPNSPNGKLMIAVCQEIGDRIQIESFKAGFKTADTMMRRLCQEIEDKTKAALVESFKAGFEAGKLEKNPESF